MLHEFAALHLIQPLYGLYRTARPALRPAMLAYRQGLRFRQQALTWSDDRKREWVLRRLREVVRQAYAGTAYYREVLDGIGLDPRAEFGFADFARLPVLERGDLRAAGESIRSTQVPSAQLRRDSTGGSTGEPTRIWTGPEERGWRESGSEFFMRRVGLRKGVRLGLLWGHHLDPVASERFGDRLRAFSENLRWYECLRLSPEVLRGYHRELQRWQPRGIVAYASALGSFVEEVARLGERPRYPTQCFVTGAEKLLPQHRALVAEVFGRPVYERYGGRDVGLIGFQTGGLEFEIDWANVLVEPDSEAETPAILVTKLHADGMPMLRYRVGDLGRFPAGSQPGHPSLRLEEVVGRSTDRLFLRDGRWVHGNSFPHLMKDFPIAEFQVCQARDYAVTIRVVPRGGFSDDTREAVLAVLRANLEQLPVRVELVEAIARTAANKRRPVVSEIDPSQLSGIS